MHKILLILFFALCFGFVQAQTVKISSAQLKIRSVNKGENNLIQNTVVATGFPMGGYIIHIISSQDLIHWETRWICYFDIPASGHITIGFPIEEKETHFFWKVELVRQWGSLP